MTDRKEDDVAAFPSLHAIGDLAYSQGGMSLRDWFAGQALTCVYRDIIALGAAAREDGISPTMYATKSAYEIADAMLEARSTKK